jgi:dipeptidyl aminopeptidase/acylaminoacyl peptidase
LIRKLFVGLLAMTATQADAAIARYGHLVLSADGKSIATVENSPAGSRASDHSVITVRAARDGKIVRRLNPCPTCSYADLTWSRIGTLTFLGRDAARKQTFVFVSAGDFVRRVAVVDGLAASPRFSPQGDRIALLVTLGATKDIGATQAGARQIGEIGSRHDEQRLALIDAPGTAIDATPRMLTAADRYIYEFAWTPNGRTLVATTAPGNGDEKWWVASLDAFDVMTGARREIAGSFVQMRFPRVSPDGRDVAFIGGLMSDYSEAGGDIWTVPILGGKPVNRTKGSHSTATSLEWTGRGLRVTVQTGADVSIAELDGAGGYVNRWTRMAGLAAGSGTVSYSADGTIAATVVQDFTHAPAIYAGPLRALRQVTRENDGVAALVRARTISWQSDGEQVQGWLLEPVARRPDDRAPLIVNVHGGPANSWLPNFIADGGITAALIGEGYDVFLPNPRGSYGRGEAFTAANRRDFGGGDLRDILAGVDAVARTVPIDEARIGLMGRSYGGFMAMWANTQTDRFHAIVAIAGISNWISLYGTNGINEWMRPYFGESAYRDPAVYLRASPLTHINKAKTPTLIYVGERDIEVPPTQSVEYWRALKELDVPTSLVIYPDEGHEIRDANSAADSRRRTVAWFNRYLPPRPR